MNDSVGLDPMAQIESELDDLGNLFDFGDIDLNNIPDNEGYGDQLQQEYGGQSAGHGYNRNQLDLSQDLEQAQKQQQSQYSQPQQRIVPSGGAYSGEPNYVPSVQQMYHQSQPQPYYMQAAQGFQPHQHVPPTPNSLEMHGKSGSFMQQAPQMDLQQRSMHYQLHNNDAIAFTPMVSPVGTPQYNMLPEYTTPGAYFSPLTSPMLYAQNQQQAHFQKLPQQGYRTDPSSAPSSTMNSPIDPSLNVDMRGDGTVHPSSTGPEARKSRRKIATPRSVGASGKATRNVTQKAQKRKTTNLSSEIPTSAAEAMGDRMTNARPPSGHLQVESSEADSVSPESLIDTSMAPPPRPSSSVHPSPNMVGQRQHNGTAMTGTAATPKSLLTMRPNQQPLNGSQSSSQPSAQMMHELSGLDDISLPEAARQTPRRPSLTLIDTQIPDGKDRNTPRLGARKTPKLGPLSTPTSARPSSAVQSPVLGSPMTASTPSAILDKNNAKGGRGNKKRGSMSVSSSKLVSPALVPRISPSIKPLLPEGTNLHSAEQALLLASKSNYQNLVEGNRLPGVSYPDSLSSGLTSKRTSHKVAEQGRRNRINEALKEMQALIPKPSPSAKSPTKDQSQDNDVSPEMDGMDKAEDENSKESKEDVSMKSNNSKAATVELANEYIKRMQKDHASQIDEVVRLRRENEDLRRKLLDQNDQPSGEDEMQSERSSTSSRS